MNDHRQLRLRMIAVWCLLLLCNVGFLAAVAWLCFEFGPWLVRLFTTEGLVPETVPLSLPIGPLTLLVGAVVFLVCQFVVGHHLAMRDVSATAVSASDEPQLHRMVNQLAMQAEVPKPSIAVVDEARPNCFVVGRSGNATIVISSALDAQLDEAELEAVLAHEVAHIANRDVTLMTIASLLTRITDASLQLGRYLVVLPGRALRHSRRGSVVILLPIVFGLATGFLSWIFWLTSSVTYRILSQYRELMADRGGVRLTGNPAALASALRKLSADRPDRPEDMRALHAGVASLCLLPHGFAIPADGEGSSSETATPDADSGRTYENSPTPLGDSQVAANPWTDEEETAQPGNGPGGFGEHWLPPSHPPVEERLDALEALTADTATR